MEDLKTRVKKDTDRLLSEFKQALTPEYEANRDLHGKYFTELFEICKAEQEWFEKFGPDRDLYNFFISNNEYFHEQAARMYR